MWREVGGAEAVGRWGEVRRQRRGFGGGWSMSGAVATSRCQTPEVRECGSQGVRGGFMNHEQGGVQGLKSRVLEEDS